ncbi:MAG: sodium:proton antiporter [Proteobacteria bacterium]|nr:sodium:proton antiporter [Pseudomonadota bacterium]
MAAFDGATLSLAWGAPFAGLLLAIAIVPMVAPQFWHAHYGKVAALAIAALLIPFAVVFGTHDAAHQVAHAVLLEYIPFVLLLLALYTVAGGIMLTGPLAGTAGRNTALLAAGSVLASVMGTTGAAMLLIRPLIAGNAGRRSQVHVIVFFIIVVGNVGGSLTPLGDPPLFIGFLKGVDFFWTTEHIAVQSLGLTAFLLAMFYALDRWHFARDPQARPPARVPFGVHGLVNVPLLAAIVAMVLLSGIWKPGVAMTVLGTPLEWQNLARDASLLGITALSLTVTPRGVREANVFHWGPILEVAKLFIAIFVTIIPVIAILQAGRAGALAPVIAMVTSPDGAPDSAMYYVITGTLSALLDNAPTYLVFFNLAGGDARTLMGPLGETLAAMSMGAVYFGALTYVGNAPNFMIRAVAEDRGVPMPSFFGYIGWALLILGPPLALIALTIR